MQRAKVLFQLIGATTVAFFCFAGLAHPSSERVLRIRDKDSPPFEEKSTRPVQNLGFISDVSQRNLLALEREAPFSPPRLSKVAFPQMRTLRILAIRVEFEEEIPDDPRTTGNGLFDMRAQEEFLQEEGHLIDPSPHDTLFFTKHIQALHNYWSTVSSGGLALEGQVFPKHESLAYRLPDAMAHYGAPDSSLSYKVEMLRQFFHDSFNLADSFSVYEDPQIYGIDFSQYDCFVIFHAGSDLQSDLGELVNPTPGDLFTGYIRLSDTVWVDGDTFPITDGIFMPETRSQDNRVGALNAEFAHEFGHQLGLPDLYNSVNFMTQVGDFALMDNNAQNVGVDVGYDVFVNGVLPVYPCAWSKAFLGFVEPVEIKNQTEIELRASEMLTDQLRLIRIPISPSEYFLVENRQQDLDGDGFSALRADSATNVILGPVDAELDYNREYDWLLPGSGTLIWHLDEDVAYYDYDLDGLNNFWDNHLQVDKDRRFLELEEADGIIDFGGNYYTGFGRAEDMFRRGNNADFGPYTFPSSRSRGGSDTHIQVADVGRSDTVMTLDVSTAWVQAGFPQKFIPEAGVSSLVSAENDLRIFASSGRFIHGWDASGASLFPYPDSVEIMLYDSTLTTLPLAIFAEENEDFVGPPSLGDLDGDDTLEVVAATAKGKVCVWHPYDRDQNGRADPVDGFPLQLGDPAPTGITTMPVIANFDSSKSGLEIFVATDRILDVGVVVISSAGEVLYSSPFQKSVYGLATTGDCTVNFVVTSHQGHEAQLCKWNIYSQDFVECTDACGDIGRHLVVGDLDRDGSSDVVFCCMAGGEIYAYDTELGLLEGFPVSAGEGIASAPVLGDLDKDGYLEIILASGNKIFAYNFNGAPVGNFPVMLSLPGGGTDLIDSSPILGDADGDGYPDIIVGTKDGRIVGYSRDGRMVGGFPLPVGGPVRSSPLLINLDRDSDVELLVACDDGFIYAWDLPAQDTEESMPWPMYGFDAGHTNYFPKEKLPELPALAGDLLPQKTAFNYPNPAGDETIIRYFLKEDAAVGIRVYDLSGMLVDQFPGPGQGRTHNERIWDCSGFASGVYLCRVEAKSTSQSQVVFFKMAIVK